MQKRNYLKPDENLWACVHFVVDWEKPVFLGHAPHLPIAFWKYGFNVLSNLGVFLPSGPKFHHVVIGIVSDTQFAAYISTLIVKETCLIT